MKSVSKFGIVRNTLGRKAVRQVEDLILENKDAITRGEYTLETFAAKATTKLGFAVSGGNVFGAAQAVEVVFPRRKGSSKKSTEAVKSLSQLRACVGLLAREVADLKGQYGVTVSPTLEELCALSADPNTQAIAAKAASIVSVNVEGNGHHA